MSYLRVSNSYEPMLCNDSSNKNNVRNILNVWEQLAVIHWEYSDRMNAQKQKVPLLWYFLVLDSEHIDLNIQSLIGRDWYFHQSENRDVDESVRK